MCMIAVCVCMFYEQVLQAEVISVDELNDGPFHRGPARLTHLVLRKRDNQIPHSQVKPRPLDDNTATIIKHEQPEPPRAFDESDISATLIKALCDESTGDDEYRMAIDSVFEGASELRAAAAHELRALIPVGSMVGTNDDGRDSNSDDRRFHMGLSGEDKFAEAMDVYLARTAVATLSSSTATIETTTPTPTMPSIDDSLSNICSITRSTLNGCVVGIASGVDCGSNSNDVTTTSPPVKKSQRSGRSGGNKRRGRDPLLACAGTSVAIACGATTRATPQRCRYCWLPFSAAVDAAKTRDACMCGELASLKKAHKEEQFKLMPSNFCVRNEAPLSMPYASPRAAASTQVWPRVHFVVVCHPNEFMRSTSTAKIATTLLGNTGNTNPAISSCSMLVVGAPRHEARLNALLSAAALDADDNDHKRAKSEDHTNAACRDGELGRVRVLFPWSENEDDSVANALTFGKVQLRAAAPNIECLPQDDDGSSCIWHSNNLPVLTVLVPDGSWACATALVAQLDRKVRDIQASNFLTASDGDSVENFVEDDDNGGGSGRETDKKKNSNSNDVLPLNQGLKFVRLCRERVASHHSPLIEALRAGCGNGRLSTLEAMAMFLDEAAQAASGHDTVPTVDSAAPSAMLDSAPIEATSRVAPTAVPTYPSVENIENAELAGWYTPSQWAHLASSDAQLLRSGLQPLVRHVQRENKVLRAAVAVGTTDGSATTSSSTFREGTSHDKVGASMYGEISKTYPRSKITGQKNDTKHVLASWVTALEATATAREKHAVSAQAATSNSIDIPTVAAATEAAVTSAAAHPHWAGAPGLRRCIVCGAALSTPLRWRAHLSGKKHLEAVARKHLVGAATRSGGATSGDAPVEVEALRSGPPRERNVPTTKECEAALALHSDAPLNENSWLVEPPDVALAAVAGALSLRSF